MLTGSILHHLSAAPLHYAAVCMVDCSPHLNVRPWLWYFLPLLLNGWNDTDHRLSTVCASEAGHCYCSEAFHSLHISSSLGALTYTTTVNLPELCGLWGALLTCFYFPTGRSVSRSRSYSLLSLPWCFTPSGPLRNASISSGAGATEMCVTLNTG